MSEMGFRWPHQVLALDVRPTGDCSQSTAAPEYLSVKAKSAALSNIYNLASPVNITKHKYGCDEIPSAPFVTITNHQNNF